MIESNAISGAGDLLSEIQGQIAGAASPTLAFTLIMQKQALQDRVRFKQWLDQSQTVCARSIDAENERNAAAMRLTRRASYAIPGV